MKDHATELRGPALFDPAQATITIAAPEPEHQSGAENAPARPKASWITRIFLAGASLLVSLLLIDWGWSLVLSLHAKHPVAGQIALGVLAVLALLALIWLTGQMLALRRLARVEHLRNMSDAARADPDEASAKAVLAALHDFYAKDSTTAAARAEITAAPVGLHDPATLLDIAERALFANKDAQAQQAIADAAQRVSIVTAASPRAIIDVLFVAAQSVMLIRKLSTIYGGRASGYGLWRLASRVVRHLAITGGVAVADSLLGQVLGTGLAARLSAKLGEGVLNGILTARVGLAALALTRPMSFSACEPIVLSKVVKTSIFLDKAAEKPAA